MAAIVRERKSKTATKQAVAKPAKTNTAKAVSSKRCARKKPASRNCGKK